MFEKYRQLSEASPSADERVSATLADPLPSLPEPDRLPATFEPCWLCPVAGVPCPIFWEDGYGLRRCAACSWPPSVSLVRRVLVLVPTSVADARWLVTPEKGESFDVVDRPDILSTWKRLERERVARRAEKEEDDDGY